MARQKLVKDLSSIPELQFIEVQDGRQALQICIEQENIDLILSDINMPGLDGLDFLAELQNRKLHEKTPKVMVTTESSAQLKARGKALGVMAWVLKPYTAASVVAAVKKILNL
jgi:two-component system chemotaxis response regulator CheY